MTPSIGAAACWASATPITSVHARRVKPRPRIRRGRADLGSRSAESARCICEIFISCSLIIIFLLDCCFFLEHGLSLSKGCLQECPLFPPAERPQIIRWLVLPVPSRSRQSSGHCGPL